MSATFVPAGTTTRAEANLLAADLTTLVTAVAGSNVFVLPTGASWANVKTLNITVSSDGTAKVNATIAS